MKTEIDSIPMPRLPRLTEAIAPVPAAIKRRYEDFRVEEIPAYAPCGEGDHCLFTIEKRGLATMRAVQDIARGLGVPAKAIGLAGLKDARAVAVQQLSVEHVDPHRIETLAIPRIRVLAVARHRNKLKIGHLKGNRFRIRMREVAPGRAEDIRRVCAVLLERGVPNYFGPQRFGTRGDTGRLGKAVLQDDAVAVVDGMLGRAGAHDTGDVLKARQLYDSGRYAAAARAWPWLFRDHAALCRVMDRTGGNHRRAFHAIDIRSKKFFLGAYQSYLFNLVLAQRVDEMDRVRAGDLACKHESGGVFRVEDVAAEQPRAEAFEISPTGPIFGFKMTEAAGEPGARERAVLEQEDIRLEDFRGLKRIKLHGARRPLRFRIESFEREDGADPHGPFVELRFTLPSGCYATMILSEICKDALAEGLVDEGE
ncbi:MAG: tRNA pseudouridine(13) synthase TruD [Myxococcota bacterium]